MVMSVAHNNNPDPIDSQDTETLRLEILRLRDKVLGAESQTEVLQDYIADLQQLNTELNQTIHELAENSNLAIKGLQEATETLRAEMQHAPTMRIARAVARRLRVIDAS